MKETILKSILTAGALIFLSALTIGLTADTLTVASLPTAYYRFALVAFVGALTLLLLVADYGRDRVIAVRRVRSLAGVAQVTHYSTAPCSV